MSRRWQTLDAYIRLDPDSPDGLHARQVLRGHAKSASRAPSPLKRGAAPDSP